MEKIRIMILLMWKERYKILRFLISGGTATAVDFFFLYALTEWAHFYYLLSVVLAFLISVAVSFVLQKFWTFQSHSKENMNQELLVYMTVAVINMTVNTILVYVFVEYAHLHYLVAQFISSALIALESFFIYHFFIFKDKKHQ